MVMNDFNVGEDLVNLTDISEENVIRIIEERFNNKRIYTNIGDVLLAINAFEKYRIYDDSVIAQYRQFNKYAHIFSPARSAVENIENGSHSENIVFSGESNSGKSFNAFQVMKYFVTSQNSKITVKHIEAITSIFNSFGCAKTVKNNDATRFGYCMDFLFQKNRLVGLNVCPTLPLEATRVISQKPGERNFNVFYELCAGMPSEVKADYGIRDQQKFFYLSQGKAGEFERNDSANFQRLHASLETMGFSDEHRESIYKTLATILHLGNMYFRERRSADNDTQYVEVGNNAELKWVCYLLDIEINQLIPCFTGKITKTEEGLTSTPYSISQALDVRDALATTLYEALFNWILSRVSSYLKCPDHNAIISVVDCYGIERYNNNGLEQLLINTVNERLQNAFIKQTFLNEIADYATEGLIFNWKIPMSLENDEVIDLLSKKPYGLLNLIDDECKFPKTSDESYFRRCNLNHLDKNVYGKAKNKDKLQMSIRHSFGTTWYNVHGFVQRNKRSMPYKMINILANSQNSVISMLFRSLTGNRENADHVLYTAHQFNTSSMAIIEKILNGRSHFIHCLKSNNERLPACLDKALLSRQLSAFSTLETLSFQQTGFPVRISFQRFTQSYRCLLPSDIAFCQNQKEIIIDILDGQGIKYARDFQIGSNYVFLRSRLADQLRITRERIHREAAYVIQKTMRMYVLRKAYLRKRNAVIRIQAAVRAWMARKKYSELREKMFKELTIETSRSRRLSVYHEVLMSKSPTQRSSSSLLGCLDTGIESLIKESRPAVHGLKTTTDYLPSKLRSNIDAIEPISIKRFAMENFKGHILEPRREPILSPFLHKNSEDDFRLSLDLFKLLLKYMYNQTCTKHQLDDIGRHIIKQGINNPCQRDEIFAQLCNQIYRNPDKEAQSRCCRLLLQAVGAFPPSKVVLQMLISVCKELPGSLQTQLLSTITRRMNIPNLEAARLLPASHLEMGAINGLHNPAVKINSRDGQSYIIETHSWMTNEELVNKLLRHRGIGNPHGWSVEVETETRLYYPAGSHFFYDVISEIELGKEKSDRSHFFNHCNQRLLSPINKKKADSQNKFSGAKMSPVVKRHMKQTCSDNHEVPRSVRTSPGGSHYDRSVNMQSNSITSSQSPRQTYGNDDDENNLECCYTLPVKQNPLDASHSQYSSYATIYRKRTEDDRPGLPRQQPLTSQMSKRETPDCQEVPEQCYKENNSSKRTDELLNEHLPNQYYTAANIPMVQYVPVLLPPQSTLISKQMEHAVIHPSMLVPVSNISQGSDHHPHSLSHENNYQFAQEQEQLLSSQQSQIFDGNLEEQNKTTDKDRPRDIDTMKLAVHPEFDSVRSISSVATRGGRCDSRLLNSRCDYIPSVHSTVSVASQIRNMPVPNSNRDVDRFLDEVFDQVLSPHEMAIEMNNNEIAASIKGGAYDSMTLVAKPCEKLGSCFEQRHSNTELDRTSIETENENHFENDPAICTTDCQSMEGNNSRIYASYSHQFTPNSGIQQSPRNGEVLTSRNNLDGQYQIYLMMPMQMNSPVSQLVPVVMQPGMTTAAVVPNMTGYTVPRQQNMLASPGQQQIRPLNSYPPSTGGMLYYPSGIVTNPVQSTYLSVQPNTVPRQMSGLVNSQQLHVATLPSPHPNYTVKPSGLTNIQQVPHQQGPVVVRNTMINSEHPNPNKFRFAEKNLVKEIQQKEQEALRKITERMKNLPPPIDQFRILTKKRDVVTHGSSVTQGCRVPNEARQTYSSLYSQTQRPQTDWVFHNGVEKRAELMPTSSAAFSLPIDPQMYHANPASLQQKPAVKYIQQPWKLNIRKEMFHPQEMLDDLNAINQVFDQIISDCRNGFTYRIRAYERDDIVNILMKHNIAPEILDKPEEIPVGVKVAVISAARKWPLYFTQNYEVVEERSNEFISLVLSLSEHGVRLLLPTPSDTEDPLKVQDHFSFADLFNVNVENDGFLCLNARNGMTVRLRTQMAHQIKAQIDKCLFGQMELKQFVRAKCNYVTVEQNFLSFAQGDIIELVNHPNNGEALSGMWLYGKIGNRYGLFSEQYVEPVDENNREVVESPPFLSYAFDDAGDDVGHMNGHHYTMLEFALTHFRVSKPYQSSNKKNKQDDIWRTAVQMIKYTKTPITQSLIRFDSDDLNDFACETFLCIMRYMGDEQPGRGETITDSVYRLLSICYKNSPIRDEVYCQIIRQTTNNKSVREDSPIRGWRLFTILTAYFDCSIALRPYLLGYLTENADDYRRLYHGTAQLCLQNLSKTVKYGGRQFLMNATEVEEITNGKIFKRQIFGLPGGREKVVNTKIVTVVEDVIKELCQEMNIRSSSEQQEFSLFYVIENGNQSEYCANTKYILDINSELEYQHQEYHFVLKRCTWVYPLRLDNPLYIEMMYYQILPDYLNGILVTKNRNGDLNASTTEDISKLAAYIYLTTDEASRADITRQTIRSLIPSNVIDSCSLPSESWVKKIKSQLEIIRPTITATQSRALFLEVLSNWPLFGSTIFHLQSVSCDGRLIPLVVLSVGKTGVKLLNEITHDVIEEWSYDMIIYAKANCQETAVEMVVSKLEATFIYEFLTNESSAITRLVSQYTFIVKENRLLFNV